MTSTALPASAFGLSAQMVDVPAGPLAVIDTGGTPDRRAVLLVPGFTGSKEDFAPVVRPLADAGHRVVAIDMRGQNESPGPDDPAAYTQDSLAADLLALIDVLGLAPVHLVGHSYGGLVARTAVLASPSSFASLTLLDSGPAHLGEAGSSGLRSLLAGVEVFGVTDVLYDAVLASRQTHGDPPLPAAAADFQRTKFLASPPAALIGMAGELMTCADEVDRLAAATADADVPVLVAFGVDDGTWSPADQTSMAARLGAAVAVIDDAGHSPAVENPQALVGELTGFFAFAESRQDAPA